LAFRLQIILSRGRVRMLFARFPITGLCRVEVSGWDKYQAFFVEKSGKCVALTNAVLDGAVVFLRLLQSLGADRWHPVPYEAEFVAVTAQASGNSGCIRSAHARRSGAVW
jgi:hypothetical protein